MWQRLVGVVLAGCATAPAAPPAQPPSDPDVPVAQPYDPPPLDVRPAFHTECHAFTSPSPAPATRTKIYDFMPFTMLPVRRGPRAIDRPRIGLGRHTRALRLVIADRATDVQDCWKYAASRGATPTTLAVMMTIEPLGSIRELAVTSDRAQDDALAACVQDALSTISFSGATTHPTRFGFSLDLRPADQPAWQKPWPKPIASPATDGRRGTVCTPVIDDGVIHEVRLLAPLVAWDYDPSRTAPSRGRRAAVPSVRIGCAQVSLDNDKRAIRTAILSNLGAYQTCFADARDRDPELTGEIALRVTFNQSGSAVSPKVVSGPGDPALHACLVTALQEIWVIPPPPQDGALEVNVPFALVNLPTTTPSAEDAAALLAAGDPDAALAAWTAKLRTPVSAQMACIGRAGVLLAIAELSPWLDDSRTRAAIADLAVAAAKLPMAAASACVDPVQGVIERLTRVRGQPFSSFAFTRPWLDRYTTALPLAPFLDAGSNLRWWYAKALLATPRAAEGRDLLQKLAWDPKVGPAVTEELQSRADRVASIFDNCSD
jgi:hypothetical protein